MARVLNHDALSALGTRDKKRSFDLSAWSAVCEANCGKRRTSLYHRAVLAPTPDALVHALKICRHADIDSRDSQGITPLHLCCIRGNIQCLRILLDSGANIDHRDKLLQTPLHRAVLWECLEIVEELVRRGCDVNAVDHQGRTPLAVAATIGSAPITKILLPLTVIDDIERYELMKEALMGERGVAVCELLMDCPSILDSCDNDGDTLLHSVAKQGTPDGVKFLISHGFTRFNALNDDGHTPLHAACVVYNVDVAIALLKSGKVDVTAGTQDDGLTPLHIAALDGGPEITEAILDVCPGALFCKANEANRSKTALHVAAEWDNWEVAEVLVERGGRAIADEVDSGGNTALAICAEWNSVQTLQILLQAGADVNVADPKHGLTALHRSSRKGNVECVRLLLEYGANVDVRTHSKRQTALAMALARDRIEVVELLQAVRAPKKISV